MGKLIKLKSIFAVLIAIFVSIAGSTVYLAQTTNFTQTINPGILSISIVDASYVTVPSPAVAFPAATFNFACQTSNGTFGTASQQIYVRNPDAADNGWTVSLAASAVTAIWDGAAADYDFNDPTTSGCTDGVDADTVGGQMTVNANAGTLDVGNCSSCTTTGITKGTSAAFAQGSVDSITILTASAGSNDIGDFTLEGVTVSQTIPAEQPAASDYDINMVLSIVSN